MISRIYSIFDVKALSFSPPYLASSDGAAVRMLMDVLGDRQSLLARHPGDFKLYYVGEFDDSSGALREVHPPMFVVEALALVPVQDPLPLFKEEPVARNGGDHA